MLVNNKKIFIYGKKPVFEILRSSHPVDSLTMARELDPKDLHSIIKLANNRKIEINYLPKSNLQRLCGPVLHQGMVATISGFFYIHEIELMQKLESAGNPLVLILDQIQDTHNMGAIIRTAEVVGVSAIVLPEKGSSDINATVAKTSAGAIFHIPINRSPNLMVFIGKLSELQIKTAALVPAADTSIYGVNLKEPMALVIGNEQKGVRKNIRELCELKISIPQWGRIGSLNASVSVGIVLYEVMRQRKIHS
jgi:23S rRNA (guanosine2251-2'-O)-methyltransferase